MSNVRVQSSSGAGLFLVRPEDRDDVLVGEEPVDSQADREVVQWSMYQGNVYEVEIRVCPEDDGGFSVYVPTLPGVVSEGETEEDAEKNIREALLAVIESYRKDQESIPWERVSAPPEPGEIARWIVVHA
ncbi:MAG: type II toxin-antitoxin system HicB family antitoxin [Phycisphaerae bacterium]